MIKKITLFVLALLPIGLIAQNQKIGHVNSQEIIELMPELEVIETKLNEASEQWEKELLKMREEYLNKIKDFQDSQATLSESIKEARQSEIQNLEGRLTTLQQQAQLDINKKQQELLAPVLEKVRKTIEDVAKEQGLSYVIDMAAQSVIYTGASANDLTPAVKKKLDLKDKPAAAAR